MVRWRTIFVLLAVASTVSDLCRADPAQAQPSAAQLLTDVGWSADAKQRVLNGEFVTTDIPAASDKDLSLAIAFLVKTSPDSLSQDIMAGDITSTDSQVQASGKFSDPGSVTDLVGLQITGDMAQTLSNAQAGQALNLSASEIAAFDALQGGSQRAVQEQLQHMLFVRFQAYKASGLAGIAPYDRGGSSTDVGGELRKASTAAVELQKYMPALQQVLIDYPRATDAGMRDDFHWVNYNISGTTTFVLTHVIAASEGATRAVVQRQYYVSTGYNAEQAVAALLPVQEGTIVIYTNHTFTDQVAGFGSSMKRDIGRRMMASKLKQMFDKARNQLAK